MRKLPCLAVLFLQTNCLAQVIVQNEPNRLLNREEAYSLYLDNKVKTVDTFWAIQDIYRDRQRERFEEIKRHRAFYLQNHALKSLNEDEFNSVAGEIYWLRPLMQTRYSEYRDIYDRLLKKHAYAGLEMEDYFELKQTSKKWRDILASQREFYPDEIVSEMIRFILKIDRELKKV